MQANPITGKLANITKPIVHRKLIDIAAPHTNIASKLNILPIFYPVAFWYARASLLN
jgi:hypothetical protein